MGIPFLGEVAWGTHFCLFYETKSELLDILPQYFTTGLEGNEFCVWVVFDPLTEAEARDTLRRVTPDADRHLAAGHIEITSHTHWYPKDGVYDVPGVIQKWRDKLAQALARGYAGMRINGNEGWFPDKSGKHSIAYEAKLSQLVAKQQMIVLCTHPLSISKGNEIFDLARRHDLAIAKRRGNWEVLKTPLFKQAKAEQEERNEELERGVEQRTQELADVNGALRREILDLREVENKVRDSQERLRALAAHVESVREKERRRISREIHDELGQKLTALKMDLHWLESHLDQISDSPLRNAMEDRIIAASTMADEAMAAVQRIASELRPAILDSLGLLAALRHEAGQFQSHTGIPVRLDLPADELQLDTTVATTAYRIFQEILTNAARHAEATEIRVTVEIRPGHLRLVVEDNGKGVSPDKLADPRSLGLLGMEERAKMVNGRIDLKASIGRGTRIQLEIPIHAPPGTTSGH